MRIPYNDLPNVVDMERDVLCAMILKNGEIVPKMSAALSPDDFFLTEHQFIFRSIIKIHAQGISPNILTLIEELKKTGELDKVGLHYVLSIGEWGFTTAYADTHAKIIKEKSNLRKLIRATEDILHDAKKGAKPIDSIIAAAQNVLTGIQNSYVPSKSLKLAPYFSNSLKSDITNLKIYANRSTGFKNIDRQQFFAPGLYVLGATPACGKTTFCWQLLENLAENGETCIFCSYEMSALELFTKTAARKIFLRNKHTAITAAGIRRGDWSADFDAVIAEVANSDANLQVLELRDESVDDLLRLLAPLCTDQQKAPVVCLDYLQIIPSTFDSVKLGIDDTVRKLKTFQRETNTTFIVISSFNRLNYFQQVSFESFKESGGIEYSADVVWALQLNIMNQIKGLADISATRKKIEDAKKQQPRQIHLKCLKNRQGNNYDCFFNYFSAHDVFEPSDDFKDPTQSSNERKIKNGKI